MALFWLRSTNQKLVLPRDMYFASAGSLQRYGLRGGTADVHVPLPAAAVAGEALTVHHLVRFWHAFDAGQTACTACCNTAVW